MRKQHMQTVIWCLTLSAFFSLPLSAQQDPPNPRCCQDIFLTGYNLGCAATMVDWWMIDETFFTYLNNAGQFMRQANADCSRVNPAWSTWNQHVDELQRLAARLRGQTDRRLFRESATWLYGRRAVWGDELGYQIVANRMERRSTCEEHYFRFGFSLGAAQILMSVASYPSVADNDRNRAHQNGLQSLNLARTELDGLAQVRPVTGACVDLSSLRSRLMGVPQAIDPFQNADPLRAMVQEMVAQADALLLAGCGGRSTSFDPRSLAGIWRVWYVPNDARGGTAETGGEQVELTLTPGNTALLIGIGRSDNASEWQVVGDEVLIYDTQGQMTLRMRFVNPNTLVLTEIRQGMINNVTRPTDPMRIEMRR